MKLILIILILSSFNAINAQYLNNTNFSESSNKSENTSKPHLAYSSAGIAIASSLFFLLDDTIRDEILCSSVNKNNTFLKIGHSYGDIYYNIGLAGFIYASNIIISNDKFSSAGKSLFESLLVGGLASITIKYIFGRSRPYKEDGTTQFNWFETENIYNSLPSGHVITAFTTSTVISNYVENIYVSIALYSLAGLTAFQRIATDNHWFSDVFLGAGIGVIVGSYFSNLNKSKLSESSSVNLVPFISKSNAGLYLFLEI